MNKSTVAVLGWAVSMLAMGCQSMKVAADYDPEYDFDALQSYRWYAGPYSPLDPLESDKTSRNQFIQSVDTVLQEKGFQRVEAGDADFIVSIRGAIERRTNPTDSGIRYRYYDMGGYERTPTISNRQEGRLTIDIIDHDTDTVVWRGRGTKTLSQNDNPDTRAKRSLKIVRGILKRFPPQPDQEPAGWD